MKDVREGCVESIDLASKRGVIKIATSDDGAPLKQVPFPLLELRVTEDDLQYVGPGTKVGSIHHLTYLIVP